MLYFQTFEISISNFQNFKFEFQDLKNFLDMVESKKSLDRVRLSSIIR